MVLKEECQNTRLLCSLPFSSLHPPSVCCHTPKRSVSLTGVIIFTQLWLTGRAPASSWQPVYFWEHIIKFSSDLERGSPLSPFPLRARVAAGLSWMQAVIDELVIGIAKETLSLRCVEVHPVSSSKVYGFFLNVCGCVCACCECGGRENGTTRWWDSLNDIFHLISARAASPLSSGIWRIRSLS